VNFKFIFFILIITGCAFTSRAQGTVAYCAIPLDSLVIDTLIQTAMLHGTPQDVANAIDTGKTYIDTAIGCGQESYNYFPADYSKPSQIQVISDWYNYQESKIDSVISYCPGAGRYQASVALGGYYARLAHFYVGLDTLNVVAQNFLQTQYDANNAPTPLKFAPGVYGYLNLPITDSCHIITTADNDIINHYLDPTPYQVAYDNGAYANDSFYVCDYDTSTFWYWGGLAYDQAWITTMMIQAATQQQNSTYKTEYTNSAIESGSWTMQEPPEIISEITSCDIWTLAQLYDWTGNKLYYNNMTDKLNRGLLPSILTDFNKTGYVDGMNNKPFSSLTNLAQHPGRLWDPPDAVVWNTAVCANGLVEAYVAARDNGDDSEAQALKPYVNVVMNNICWQVNNYGTFTLSVLYRDIDYAVINAIWKIEEYENDPHPAWDSTAWALYNGGIAKFYGLPLVDVSLYLLALDSVPYKPLSTEGIPPVLPSNISRASVYPNPSDGNSTLNFVLSTQGTVSIKITDITGRVVENIANHNFTVGKHTINLNYKSLSEGMYFICLQSGGQNKALKWVKN